MIIKDIITNPFLILAVDRLSKEIRFPFGIMYPDVTFLPDYLTATKVRTAINYNKSDLWLNPLCGAFTERAVADILCGDKTKAGLEVQWLRKGRGPVPETVPIARPFDARQVPLLRHAALEGNCGDLSYSSICVSVGGGLSQEEDNNNM